MATTRVGLISEGNISEKEIKKITLVFDFEDEFDVSIYNDTSFLIHNDSIFDGKTITTKTTFYSKKEIQECEKIAMEFLTINTFLLPKDLDDDDFPKLCFFSRQIMLEVAKRNGMCLEKMLDKFKNDEEIVLESLKSSKGESFEFASDRLRDKVIIGEEGLKYPKNRKRNFQFVSDRLKEVY